MPVLRDVQVFYGAIVRSVEIQKKVVLNMEFGGGVTHSLEHNQSHHISEFDRTKWSINADLKEVVDM